MSVLNLYKTVVEDVISNVREAFLDEGVDEQVLQELKQMWESKFMGTRAVDGAASRMDQQISSQYIQLSQSAQAYPPMDLSQAAQAAQAAAMTLPAGIQPHQVTLPTIHSGAIALQQLPQGTQVIVQQIPGQAIGQQPQQIIVNQQGQQFIVQGQPGQAMQAGIHKVQASGMKQLDGTNEDTSSDDDDDDDDNDDEENEEQNEGENEDQGEEEEPLNSDDDVSDDDSAEVFDTDNVVVCQYEKINRSRNRWKFHLKDGIMNLNGKDYVFQKATGDAEW